MNKLIVGLCFSVVAVVTSHAVVLADYDGSAPDPYLSNDTDANSTAGAILPGPGLTPTGFLAVPFAAPFVYEVLAAYTASTKQLASIGQDYFFFTLAAAPTVDLSFTGGTLSLDYGKSATLTSSFAVFYSVNGGAATQLGSDVPIAGPSTASFQLNSLGSVTDTVSFAVLVWDSSDEVSNLPGTFFDNIVVDATTIPGTTVVPEPTTALTGVSLLGVVLSARRRRRS